MKNLKLNFWQATKKIKTGLDLELFVNKLCEQILDDIYDLETVYKTGGNRIEVTAVGDGYVVEVEYHVAKNKLLRLAVIDETIDDRRITYAVEYI